MTGRVMKAGKRRDEEKNDVRMTETEIKVWPPPPRARS